MYTAVFLFGAILSLSCLRERPTIVDFLYTALGLFCLVAAVYVNKPL